MHERELLLNIKELQELFNRTIVPNEFVTLNDLDNKVTKTLSKEELELLDELFEIAEIMADEDTNKILEKMKKIIFGNSEEN